MSGDFLPKRNLLLWGASPTVLLSGLAAPLLSGFTAVGLHGAFRYPLNIPGHHGLEFMALLTGSMLLGRNTKSGPLFSLGAAIGMPVFGIMNPLSFISYLVPGIFMYFVSAPCRHIWLTILAGGAAYASIPITRILVHITFGIPVESFHKSGYLIPVLHFFLFGLLGSLAAAGMVRLTKQNLSQKS